jgi:putative ABC transport system permease protein
LLAWWGVGVFARTAPDVIASGRNNYAALGTLGKPAIDLSVLIFALAVALGTTVVFALVPALAATRPELATALKEDDRGGGRGGRALSILVVTEVALACLLLSGSGLLIESFARIQSRRTGFVSDEVLTFWVRPPGSRYPPASGPATVDRLLASIQSVPGVQLAAVNRCTPFSGCSRSILFLPGQTDRANAPGVGRHYISADYFRTLTIPVLAGRVLTPADRAGSPPVAVVNESGARRLWPGESPIGKRVWFGTTTGPFSDPAHAVEIVGVVGDIKYEGVDQPDRPDRADFYTSYLQFAYPDTMVIVKTRGAAAASMLPAMRAAVAAVDPALPIYDAMTLEERIGAAVARPRFNAALLTAFAGAALLLAAIGVYGVLSYSVSSRMHEIGVRLALGADAARVMRLVLGEGLRLAVAGAAIGLAAATAIVRLLQGLLNGVAEPDLRVFAAAGAMMLIVAGAAALVPARRAGAVDPVVVLRME